MIVLDLFFPGADLLQNPCWAAFLLECVFFQNNSLMFFSPETDTARGLHALEQAYNNKALVWGAMEILPSGTNLRSQTLGTAYKSGVKNSRNRRAPKLKYFKFTLKTF